MVIVDSTVWIDFLAARGTPECQWMRREYSRQRIGLTDLILCEVLQGLRDEATSLRIQRQFATLPILEMGGTRLAVASAGNYRLLRSKGIAVRKTIDCLIATFCIEHRHLLLHRDHDFDPFEIHLGLRVIHP